VFVATLGPLAEHTLRAGFLANVLTAGGIPTVEAGPTLAVGDVLAAYDGQSAVVCLAGTDAAYGDRGAEVIAGLRNAGASRVLLAGTPSTSLSAVVDDHIAAGEDVLAFLLRTRRALTAASGSENPR
jgi:methylmalonyl-CoA mutase